MVDTNMTQHFQKSEQPKRSFPLGKIAIYIVLVLGVIIAIGPFLWMVSASVMETSEINLGKLLPSKILLENYPNALARANFIKVEVIAANDDGALMSGVERTVWIVLSLLAYAGAAITYFWGGKQFTEYRIRIYVLILGLILAGVTLTNRAFTDVIVSGYIYNSIRVTMLIIVLSLGVNIPAAYAFARMNFVGKDALFGIMLSTMMIPGIVMLVPHLLTVIWFGRLSESIFGELGVWFDNWPALVIPGLASAFNIFLLRQFFRQIPDDLWDAARIDGAGHMRFLIDVVLPLSKAPVMTIITLEFIGSWNSLLWPLLVTSSDKWRPIAVGLSNFVTADAPGDFNLQMAGSVMMAIPILIVYFVAQKQFTEGIAQSGLKG